MDITQIFLQIFSGLATIITGLVAFLIYFVQKKDAKVQAAKVLLTEIRIAEDRINQIRDKVLSGSPTDLPIVFPTQNWQKYSHIFINEFDQDELGQVNCFYDYGLLVEEFARRNNEFFWITTEERAKVAVQCTAQYINEFAGQKDFEDLVKVKRDLLSSGMDAYAQVYAPSKTLAGIKDYLQKIPKITTSSCGMKLKKIAKLY